MLVLYSAVTSFIGFILSSLFSVVYKEEFLPPPPSISTIDCLYGSGILIRLIILYIPDKFLKREKKMAFFVAVDWDIGIVGQILPQLAKKTTDKSLIQNQKKCISP